MKESLLISACLLGAACRYDGARRPLPEKTLCMLHERFALIPVCPEQLGGLPTPRPPAERRCGGVFTAAGEDVSAQYRRGAAETLRFAAFFGCRSALLKERSPSCGCGRIYDGSFTGTLCGGDGVTAEMLKGNGIAVCGESGIESLI